MPVRNSLFQCEPAPAICFCYYLVSFAYLEKVNRSMLCQLVYFIRFIMHDPRHRREISLQFAIDLSQEARTDEEVNAEGKTQDDRRQGGRVPEGQAYADTAWFELHAP